MNAAAAVYTSPSSSASSSPSPPASPSTRPDARQKQDMPVPEHVHPDLDGGECLLKYNVFVLDASPAEVEAKLPQLVARPEPPMQTAAHTDGTDAHTQGEGAEEAWRRRAARPNIVDFAIREREEMRDLTRASELITVLPPRESAVDSSDEEDEEERVLEYSGTTPAMRFDPLAGQVFLGNAHDAPPTHPGASIPFTPGANAPKLGRGFDLCIECYDYAPLPTMAQLRAAEGQVAALDRAWVEHCLAEDDENDGEGRDGKDGEELPPRPPPHHSAVVHLTFPSSPASTAASVNAVLPVLAFLERLIAPPSSPPTRAAARALLFPSPLHSQPPQHGPRRASEAASFGPRSLPPPSAFPTSFFPNAHAHGPQTAYTRMRSTSATCPPGSSSPAPPSSPGSSASSASSPTVDLTAALRTRPAKILIHSADGYTESSVLGLTLLMAHRALALPAAYLTLQLEKRRSFFVYQADIPLLRRIEARLQRERAAREQEARETGGVGWGAHKPQERGAGSPGPASAPESRAPWGSWSRVSSKSVSFAPGSDTPVRGEALPVVSHPCRTVSESYSAVSVEAFAVHSRPRAQTLPPALPDVVGAHQLWFNDPRFDGSFPSRVLPFLYLGNLNHASNAFMLHALGITHVVSVGECALVPPPEDEAPAQSGKCTLGSLWHEEREGRIKVLDIKGVCDDGIDTLAPQLEPICEWIERARAEGGTVLVHCRVGVSRSATVTIAYVMKHLQLPLVDAYLIVRSRRLSVLIQPNMRLLYNLLGWELHLARERAAGNEERLRYELARCLNWPYLAKEVHALNEKYLH
ncbi:hypothetical protein OBBRIDRAFT_298822 [Obba rivulosa]|uniref:Protein-tyrosine-phosphatase n=1 Tax=Obba rivulosa TaxID=1052685 RepID=A0A8E2ALI4_9APHY|nr:hypothetical protein OBBRIDRAFT_298822 [Obba rivulosa]